MSESTISKKSSGGSTYIVDNVHLDNRVLSNGFAELYSIPAGKTGYTPIGIINVNIENGSSSGTGRIYCTCSSWYLEGTNAKIAVQKILGTKDSKIKVVATILYKKN